MKTRPSLLQRARREGRSPCLPGQHRASITEDYAQRKKSKDLDPLRHDKRRPVQPVQEGDARCRALAQGHQCLDRT